MKQRFLNVLSIIKKRNGLVPLCKVLFLIGAIAILSACTNTSSQNNNYTIKEGTVNSEINIAVSQEDIMALAEEQAKVLDIILFFEVGDNQAVIDTDRKGWELLLENISEKAFERDSFRYLQENRLSYERAAYWGVSDVYLNELSNELIFNYSANIAYALGRELKLEVYMVKEDGAWKFQGFGSLYIEKFGDEPEHNITIEDFIRDFK
ncbi:MAG TPA: hypothetical protein IAA29_20460 [Candidatus Paenibacillus intestinavium]|nr:hypothetical protein [Candidatus Paenibacillus intestinavium]